MQVTDVLHSDFIWSSERGLGTQVGRAGLGQWAFEELLTLLLPFYGLGLLLW